MSTFTIYHNPRCSKSRQTLELLQENGIEPTVVTYLDNPPSAKELKTLLKQLDLSPLDLMRKNESAYKTAGIQDGNLSEDELIAIMVSHPILIERPIVSNGKQAVIGRPPKNVLELI
ncbi:MAG: arsenate reductase (glutaredoxin) [Coxiellaceae bacterium]|nr:arsenate reductase (glutaredoxin) [Coxiellaceae bacterium]